MNRDGSSLFNSRDDVGSVGRNIGTIKPSRFLEDRKWLPRTQDLGFNGRPSMGSSRPSTWSNLQSATSFDANDGMFGSESEVTTLDRRISLSTC